MQYSNNITKRIALAVIILVIVTSTAFFFLNYTKQGAVWKVTSFANNEETYKLDGIEETFKVKDVLTLRCPFCWSVEIEYQSKSSGYGNRSNQVVAQVITPHTARIMVDKGKITYAVLDENWDVINQRYVEHAKEEVIQTTSISQEQAKAIAESKINEVKAQTEFVDWEELWANTNATVGTPYLVRTVDEKPLYWNVPVILNEKVIGSIEVKMDGRIPRYGGMGCLYSPYYKSHNLDNCSSTIIISTAQEAKEIARNLTDKYNDTVISEPIYIFDDTGCCSGEAWMLKIEKDSKIISRVFVAGSFAYERREEVQI